MKSPQHIFRALKRRSDIWLRTRKAASAGVSFMKPNYLFFDRFSSESVIFDVGCGSEAELSNYMIDHYGLKAYGVDPTRKHKSALQAIEQKQRGHFIYVDKAVGAESGLAMFYESEENESGSMLAEHGNVKRDRLNSYKVEVVSLSALLGMSGRDRVDYVKLDLEGAEYGLIESLEVREIEGIDQLLIEFHHHCVSSYSQRDTELCVEMLESLGMRSLTVDDHNYLFYR